MGEVAALEISILVVDDTQEDFELLLHTLQAALKKEGCNAKFSWAKDPAEAVKSLEEGGQGPFELVILDFQLASSGGVSGEGISEAFAEEVLAPRGIRFARASGNLEKMMKVTKFPGVAQINKSNVFRTTFIREFAQAIVNAIKAA